MSTRDAGCWIEGSWGQYGIAREVEIASDYGYEGSELIEIARRKLAAMSPSRGEDLTVAEEEALSEGEVEVTAWLNEHVAADGYSFEWSDGEFFLASEDWWQEQF